MTDLEKAIAEVRQNGPQEPWTATLVCDGNPYPSALAGHVATILNAVLSGTMIPATERDAAVAVTVKPLVWDDGGSAEFPLRAEGYWIDNPKHDYAVLHANGRLFSNGPSNIVFRGNLACHQAKAAAQADHEARIRAAIWGVE